MQKKGIPVYEILYLSFISMIIIVQLTQTRKSYGWVERLSKKSKTYLHEKKEILLNKTTNISFLKNQRNKNCALKF